MKMFAPTAEGDASILDVMEVTDLTHPFFTNITLSASNTLDIATTGQGIKPLTPQLNAGNGKLIGVTSIDKYVLVAEWDAQQPC
jgi:hypothetical protein